MACVLAACCRERDLYCQPTGPNPLNHRNDFSAPALRRHGGLNSLFQVASYLPPFPGSLISTLLGLVQGVGCMLWFGVEGLVFGAWCLVFENKFLGFGVWCAGSGVEGVWFGVEGLVFTDDG